MKEMTQCPGCLQPTCPRVLAQDEFGIYLQCRECGHKWQEWV